MKIAPVVVMAAALALGACKQQSNQATVGPSASASASGETASKGAQARSPLKIEGGRLVLPAVKGNPGAAYFMLDNSGGATVSIAGIAIDGASKADMHQSAGDTMANIERVDVAPGTSITFEPGKLHVMVYELQDRLKAGGTTQLTLTFADGDKLSAPLRIEAAGGSGEHSH